MAPGAGVVKSQVQVEVVDGHVVLLGGCLGRKSDVILHGLQPNIGAIRVAYTLSKYPRP